MIRDSVKRQYPKQKVLVVGSFRSKELGVVGGIARSCEELLDSEFVERFDVYLVDSTQRANPPPNVLVRLCFAIFRFLRFTFQLIRRRPEGVLLFFSSGMSFYEKMIMGRLGKFFGATVFLFPRAGALMYNGSQHKLLLQINRALFSSGDVFFAQGYSWESYAIEACGFQKEDTYIVPNWTASDQFYSVGAARIENFNQKTKPTIAFVGWLEIEKGVHELMLACASLVASGVQFNCLLAGDGAQKTWVEEFVTKHDLDETVTCCGWLRDDELRAHYQNADIFVLPSWSEGMPNSLIEAASFGLCPVVTSVGIVPDFFVNDEHGILVEPRSVQALSDALRIVITTPELRERYSRASYQLSKQFDKNRVIPRFCDIIENKLSR